MKTEWFFYPLQNNVEAAREAFDAFLKRYPYCYGYWKKYADLLKRHELADDAEQVRGHEFHELKEISISVDSG